MPTKDVIHAIRLNGHSCARRRKQAVPKDSTHSKKIVQSCPGTSLTAGLLNFVCAMDPSDSLATHKDRSKQMC
jgi:hypothetical protein